MYLYSYGCRAGDLREAFKAEGAGGSVDSEFLGGICGICGIGVLKLWTHVSLNPEGIRASFCSGSIGKKRGGGVGQKEVAI